MLAGAPAWPTFALTLRCGALAVGMSGAPCAWLLGQRSSTLDTSVQRTRCRHGGAWWCWAMWRCQCGAVSLESEQQAWHFGQSAMALDTSSGASALGISVTLRPMHWRSALRPPWPSSRCCVTRERTSSRLFTSTSTASTTRCLSSWAARV
jgi:hypothetical protein